MQISHHASHLLHLLKVCYVQKKIQQLPSHEVYFQRQHVINIKLPESAISAKYNMYQHLQITEMYLTFQH